LPPTRSVACFTRSGLCWRSGNPRSASLHVGLNACHRLRRFSLAKQQTNPDRLRLNAVRLGGSLVLPRLSSRGFRCEKHPRRRLAADKICRVFHTLRVVLAVRYPTFRFAPRGAKCLPSASPIQPRKPKSFPKPLCTSRPSLCDLCVSTNKKIAKPEYAITQNGCHIEPLPTCGLRTGPSRLGDTLS